MTAAWKTTWRYVAGIGACLVFGWFAFLRGTRVPLLGLVDLGFHEFGHMVTYWLPDVITAVMGSITQVMVPVGLGLYFLLFRRDLLGAGVCFAWASTSAQDASVYIADAPYQRLHLIGGLHDWAFILGPQHLNMLSSAHTIAAVVKGVGFVLLLSGLACCLAGLFRGRQVHAREAAPAPITPLEMWR